MKFTPEEPLDSLDLTKLKPKERATLEGEYYKTNVSWRIALFMTLLLVAGSIGLIASSNKVPQIFWIITIVKAIGYLGLGYWARSWSIIATFLILVWHIYFNYRFTGSDNMTLRLTFWIPTLIFFWGFLGAYTRHVLIKKTKQKFNPNLLQLTEKKLNSTTQESD